MCGIAALLDPAGASATDAGQRMADALRHRGPDGQAVQTFGPATLVSTRLAIIDVAGGDQPLFSEDGQIALVANGEIYNHLDLRAGPRGAAATASRPARTARRSCTATSRPGSTSSTT